MINSLQAAVDSELTDTDCWFSKLQGGLRISGY